MKPADDLAPEAIERFRARWAEKSKRSELRELSVSHLLADAELVALQPDSVSQISFEAPHSAKFHLPSTLVRKSKRSIGFQFVNSPAQEELKTWLDKYLQK